MMHLFKKLVVWLITLEARAILARHKPQVIAVTGSVGKTTTKDAIFATLAEGGLYARKSEKSFNSEIGVPLTIIGCENAWHNPFLWVWNLLRGLRALASSSYPAWLVLEVGADRPGDISNIARWLRPDIAVLTGVPDVPVHVEFFESPRAVVREKRSLVTHLKPGGRVILNGDDANIRSIWQEFRGAAVRYGLGAENDYAASHYEVAYDNGLPYGIRFRLAHDGSSIPISIDGALGYPRVYAALAALATADAVGIEPVSAAKGLAVWEPQPGRLCLVKGIKGSIIIDDTYNSSPAAALAALDTLASVRTPGRKIAILGDMLELGRYSSEQHRTVGERAAKSADLLITVGFRARLMKEAALDAGMRDEVIREYEQDEARRAGKELESIIKPGDVILVKGSQSMRMERAVEEIMAEPEKAAELLVRQEKEWRGR